MSLSLGEFSCHVSNEVGESSCILVVTEAIMMSSLSQQDILLITLITAVTILAAIITIITLYCFCFRTKNHQESEDGGGLIF